MIKNHDWFMQVAIDEAHKAYSAAEVPVGACLVDQDGNLMASSHNTRETEKNSIGHAELNCLYHARKAEDNWRLTGSTLYVTLEPCIMCLGALIQSRVSGLVFGAYDKKGGALSLGYNFHRDKRLNHSFSVVGGVKHFECSNLLSNFFRQMRRKSN